jgi:hypothetical protein
MEPCYWNMAKLGALHLVIDKKRSKGSLENLQLGKCRLLKKFPLYIITLMLMNCNIRREWKGVP